MKVLAIDTSNQALSVAVLEDQKLLATLTTNVQKNHSISLMPIIVELLERAKVPVQTIDRVVVAQGPGSYTGLRIGVTTAKTLAATLAKELVGISSLKMLARNIPEQTKAVIVPVFDARRQNVFAGAYQYQAGELVNIIADQHVSFQQLCTQLSELNQEIIFVGEAMTQFSELLTEIMSESGLKAEIATGLANYPQAYNLGLLGLQEQPEDIHNFVPKYLRLTQAETQWLEKNPENKGQEDYVRKV
ncbi:tRNA (adenosine(37)-N6)-threonylcarbamoyltransferase complex dimerization subunit type 1 TsaB [Ligilactobacillus ceti]|uniref:Glycoprotein endopeptidase n=1 Tax=Ligilactobacillus ceti DSM 22408 TaxID=1122146 RepID=A0A0R2KLN4_9LACO|nr:tRNA (adenosine(37)-N6)-threonylcarbamoyltransferase complex dimerization subunit type 1 TsaB [Ligilactobacillus ceti]KRN88421.1 glycoprotein endopeptidase [Ligilactobacillus ceti DSM 22408]